MMLATIQSPNGGSLVIKQGKFDNKVGIYNVISW